MDNLWIFMAVISALYCVLSGVFIRNKMQRDSYCPECYALNKSSSRFYSPFYYRCEGCGCEYNLFPRNRGLGWKNELIITKHGDFMDGYDVTPEEKK